MGDAGTYFYHSHVGFQLLTAQGALIVRERDPAPAVQAYGENRILLVSDHYAQENRATEEGLLADPFRWSGEPQAVLVQGHSGTSGLDNATDPSCAPHVIEVEPGKLYRLRVIGTTALSTVKMAIEDHGDLEVVEADGAYTAPAYVDHVQVAPGQRFSFRLKTMPAERVKDKTDFWIRYESRERPVSVKGYAVLRYRAKCAKPRPDKGRPALSLPAEPPVKLPAISYDYLEHALQPRDEATRRRFPRNATRTLVIKVNQMLLSGQYVDGKLNGRLVWQYV